MSIRLRTTRFIELSLVLLTVVAKFIMVDWLALKFWFVMIAGLLWLGYLVYHVLRMSSRIKEWGFRKSGFKDTLRFLLPWALLCTTAFIILGVLNGHILWSWHLVPVLILYPLWGLVQHYLLIGLTVSSVQILYPQIPGQALITLSGCLFGAVHLPQWELATVTFVLAAVYTWLFIKYKNLWALGLFHGWLGAFFYYFVLGRDAWMEFLQAVK